MIRSKPGSFSRCVGAILCALALLLHLAFAPLRARAFAGILPAIAAGTVVTAFLMSSGIYPYEEQKEFAKYVSDNLSALWSQYLEWRTEQALGPPLAGSDLSNLTGYLTQGVIAISRSVWNTLSEFTSWVVNHFSVTNNQTGVELGETLSDVFIPPYFALEPSSAEIQANGLHFPGNPNIYVGSSAVRSGTTRAALGGCVWHSSVEIYSCAPYNSGTFWAFYDSSGLMYSSNYGNAITTSDGDGIFVSSVIRLSMSRESVTAMGIPVFDNQTLLADYFASIMDKAPEIDFSGITADTTTISALPTLPADTPWGGLAVEGVGTAATVGAVEQVIQSGVTEREQPGVKVVEVELGTNTDVDTDTGAVTENPVVVTPDVVIPSVADLTAPQAFLDALATTMTTKFPFCLPFDIMRILSAFVKEPRAPVVTLTFHDGFSDADYTVSVDLSPWDDVAAVVRQLESMLLLVGFWLNFDKFNVLNIILGQLG